MNNKKVDNDFTRTRNSNFELMRIVSMVFIIIYHIIFRTGSIYSYEMSALTYMLLKFIIAIVLVHVNSFIILTGYFQCKKDMKITKFFSINNAVWFYQVVFLIIALLITYYFNIPLVYPITKLDVFKSIIPLDYGLYWYIGCYLILYIISPILNKVINNCNKKSFQKIIVTLFILFSIIPTLTLDGVVYTKEGHSVANFILLYFIGAYLRLYPISKSSVLKRLSNTANRTLYILLFLGCSIISLLCFTMSEQLSNPNNGDIVNHISSIFFNFYNSFGSPILIIQTMSYFLFFETLDFKNKFINKISKYTLGVYLIHENIYVRDNMYGLIGCFNVKNFKLKEVLMIFFVAIIIFVVCLIIEMIRQLIFKFIYKRNFSCKFRKWYRSYFERLGLKINW